MFIQLNKNNEIIASANFKFAEDVIEINKKVVRNWDGKLVFEGEETVRPEPSLEELKQEKIAELKQNCQNYIYSVYPIYKQMNIINPLSDYSNEDRITMNAFLDEQRAICNSKEEEINEAISEEELDNIQIKWDKE
ncbi:hypothetical protein [uncultured Clostridium sp.]|uniref:hypothetical protein n=1 Tax=uncultured Clostridium sp. TaxID=59620 RepID=UPI0025FCE49F|nr:hypothetical protein [uncultured Clostridium sp.]